MKKGRTTEHSIEKHRNLFNYFISQQKIFGYFETPHKSAQKFSVSKTIGGELCKLGLIEKKERGKYYFKTENLDDICVDDLMKLVLEKRRKNPQKKSPPQNKPIKDSKQTKIYFNADDQELETLIKNKTPHRKLVKKFLNLIWDVLKFSGEILDEENLKEIKKRHKLKHSPIESLIYSGIIEENDGKHIVVANFNKKQITNWIDLSARHYSVYNSILKQQKNVPDPEKDEKPQNETRLEGKINNDGGIKKQIHSLDDYSMEPNVVDDFTVELNIENIDQNLQNKEKENPNVELKNKGDVIENKVDLIKYICCLDGEELKRAIKHLPKIINV